MINDPILLEFSPTQGTFNRQTLSALIENNWKVIGTGRIPQVYLIIGAFDNNKACDDYCKKIEPILRPDNDIELGEPDMKDILQAEEELN